MQVPEPEYAVARQRPSRGMYVLPSAFTAGNIAFGFYAMTQSVQGINGGDACFDRAAMAIGFAVLFDGLDGRVARMTNTTSDFGKELDSLADVVTFGVAPALLAYVWGFRMLPLDLYPYLRERIVPLGLVICFLFLICGACRLARFNISVNPQPRNPGRADRKYFVGMPIPAGAGVLCSVIHYFNGSPIHNPLISVVWLLLIMGTGFLMVSSWRFWSGKEISLGDRHPFRTVILLAALIAVLAFFSEIALIVLALGYLVSGVIARLAYSWGREHRRIAA
ncbi:CDP-diacylglycerol--serine O-phosphatidyltransferase [Granulicella sp. WH15]|uniref:CDP-diacylglycerol--serine O-phosphatidyltransferase n=1 Tax=Granulicella sp. WH15 TaxID=2602070 RepID=UPI002106ADE6|nr:CDP-diacylglycerol--serine O-phosphatidyltransferase [Granulicella sp. WH15]